MADDERHRRQIPRGPESAMKAIRAARLRLAGILRPTRSDTEIDEELRSQRWRNERREHAEDAGYWRDAVAKMPRCFR